MDNDNFWTQRYTHIAHIRYRFNVEHCLANYLNVSSIPVQQNDEPTTTTTAKNAPKSLKTVFIFGLFRKPLKQKLSKIIHFSKTETKTIIYHIQGVCEKVKTKKMSIKNISQIHWHLFNLAISANFSERTAHTQRVYVDGQLSQLEIVVISVYYSGCSN